MTEVLGLRLGVLSLEPWDDVWRRNQHFAARLVENGLARSIVFVEPPAGGLALQARRRVPMSAIEVLTPPLVVPRRYGGHRVTGWWLRRALADVELLWINDPVAGVGALRRGLPAVYDVTDDWREMPQAAPDRARTIAAEDRLAKRARTVVCSDVLADRWSARYRVRPPVVRNGVDVDAVRHTPKIDLAGKAPHAVYVGTLHANRIDLDLMLELAGAWPGTVHLVGPIGLDSEARAQLESLRVQLPGPIPAAAVASWLVSADVLICPHLVDEFTLSLDAIKSHEYLATDRPVVATASSGFQSLSAPGLSVVGRSDFVRAAVTAARSGAFARDVAVDWKERARAFAVELAAAGQEP